MDLKNKSIKLSQDKKYTESLLKILRGSDCKYEGKEDITGAAFEPWHFRYVGKENAEAMDKQGLCLEEYIKELKGN